MTSGSDKSMRRLHLATVDGEDAVLRDLQRVISKLDAKKPTVVKVTVHSLVWLAARVRAREVEAGREAQPFFAAPFTGIRCVADPRMPEDLIALEFSDGSVEIIEVVPP